ARGGRDDAARASNGAGPCALSAEDAAGVVIEERILVLGERAPTGGATVDRGREAEPADERPGLRQQHAVEPFLRRPRDASEGAADLIVERLVRLLARSTDHQLGDQGGAAEAAEIGAELLARAGEVEGGERVEVASLLHVQRRDALGERLKHAAEAAARPEGAAGDGGAHAVRARGQPQDLAGLAVCEALEDDGLDSDQRHGSTASSVRVERITARGPRPRATGRTGLRGGAGSARAPRGSRRRPARRAPRRGSRSRAAAGAA